MSRQNSRETPRQVAIIAYDGVDELDLVGALAPLCKAGEVAAGRSANSQSVQLQAHVVGPGPIRGSSGLVITPQKSFLDPCDFAALDALVLPGGKGAEAAARDPDLSRFVLDARSADVPFYAVCTGTLILRDLQLLEGLRVASHRRKRHLLEDARCALGIGVVRDQWLVSAGGFAPGDGLKAAEIAFCVLQDIAPDLIEAVAHRMELWPLKLIPSTEPGHKIGTEVHGDS